MDGETVHRLAAKILEQTVADWARLVKYEYMERKGKTVLANSRRARLGGTTFDELRQFLRSGYGEDLCALCGVDSQLMLRTLEGWREAVERGGKPPHTFYKVYED